MIKYKQFQRFIFNTCSFALKFFHTECLTSLQQSLQCVLEKVQCLRDFMHLYITCHRKESACMLNNIKQTKF